MPSIPFVWFACATVITFGFVISKLKLRAYIAHELHAINDDVET